MTLHVNAINDTARPVDQRTKTSCHELGHTVGVSHYAGSNLPGSDSAHSCMRSGEVKLSWRDRITYYGNHHRYQHINPWFG